MEQDKKAGRSTDKFITEKWVMDRLKSGRQNYCCESCGFGPHKPALSSRATKLARGHLKQSNPDAGGP